MMTGEFTVPVDYAAAAKSHNELMNRLPHECRETIVHMAAGAFDVLSYILPNLRVTSRMLEARMAHKAIENGADGDMMHAGLGAQAIQEVIMRRQTERGLPLTPVAPF